jgi:hypothetical protein
MDYYGLREDDDGELIRLEKIAEDKIRRKLVPQQPDRESGGDNSHTTTDFTFHDSDSFSSNNFSSASSTFLPRFRAHVEWTAPSSKEIQLALLAKEKSELLAKLMLI